MILFFSGEDSEKIHYSYVEAQDAGKGSTKMNVKWPITKETEAKNFVMKLFEMVIGGNIPLHIHNLEHKIFILEGEGTVIVATKKNSLR